MKTYLLPAELRDKLVYLSLQAMKPDYASELIDLTHAVQPDLSGLVEVLEGMVKEGGWIPSSSVKAALSAYRGKE